MFAEPHGLALTADGTALYVADTGNHLVRRVELSSGVVSTVAGVALERGYDGDGGLALESRFNAPTAVAVSPAGDLYVADTGNHRVRRVDAGGVIHTVIGDGQPGNGGAGVAGTLPVAAPRGLLVDGYGNLFVSATTVVRVIEAGNDGVATADDWSAVIYGVSPRVDYPASLNQCLAGLALANGAVPDRLAVVDWCRGSLVQVDHEPASACP
jgi:sugar lactone lactonase YvrE